MFITISETHLSNIYNKYMQQPQIKVVSILFKLISWKPMFITTLWHSPIKYIEYTQETTTKRSSFKSFQANFSKTNVYHYSLTLIYEIITINSVNYQKKTNFMSFYANFLKTNVYHYSLTLIYQIYTINTCNYHKKK